MTEDEPRVCRFHGTRERTREEDTVDGLRFLRLSCGCWQRAPGPGEVVLVVDGGRQETWGLFPSFRAPERD